MPQKAAIFPKPVDTLVFLEQSTTIGKGDMKTAIDFVDHVVDKFPFRIQTLRTDTGQEFQWQFHWHLEKHLGINHVYIKPRSPHINKKVERSHGTDQRKFYHILIYKGNVD
jgi:transposase InsO family protein